ncbi:MAG: hypothetical protein WD184_07290 [Acidimicrobiia bacterium]
MRRTITVLSVLLLALGLTGVAALASSAMLDPFTQDELDNNWEVDRQFPSGGVTSVSAHGRNDVAEIGVVGANRSTVSPFYYFEGIKKVADFGLAVQVDLYVPVEWEDAATSPLNVGFWTSDDPITAYPLIVFRNSTTVDAGFYVWNTVGIGGYIPSGVAVKYGDWNTLSIALDPDTDTVNYAINGQFAGSSYAGSDTIGQVFLNHYNDGARDYTAYWHAGVVAPQTADECKKGGWMDFGFRNQGLCIQFVKTGEDSR